MANDKTPKADDFGAPAPKPAPEAEARTIAEMSIEMEALRRQVAQLSAKPAEGFVQIGDPNENYAGEMEIDGEMTPMYFYRIDLAPCGGTDIRLSGETFFHGEVYKVTVHQLRTLREIVNRTWGHEAQINGTNENFYRKPMERTLRGGNRR
jgi:hypothetical protein